MKINLANLRSFENLHVNHPLVLNTVREMINMYISDIYCNNREKTALLINTLKQYNILEETDLEGLKSVTKEPTQLNS